MVKASLPSMNGARGQTMVSIPTLTLALVPTLNLTLTLTLIGGLNPSEVPYNITGPNNRAIRQFVTAAYMMVNGGSAGVYLTCIQCYGGHAGGLGNLSLWPEYSAPVGYPLGEPERDDGSGGWALTLILTALTVLTVTLILLWREAGAGCILKVSLW